MARPLLLNTLLTALLTALLATLALGGCTPSSRAAPADGTATVVSVTDGDTIDVDIAGRQESVRLLGIDTSNPANLHPGFTPP